MSYEPEVRVTAYAVVTFPPSHPLRARYSDLDMYDVQVEHVGDGRWAVRWMGKCWTPRGGWEFEPIPSSRHAAFRKRTRFPLDTALEHAKTAARRLQAEQTARLES